MRRTEDLLLAHLVIARGLAPRAKVREIIARRETGEGGRTPLGQRLIRAKIVPPGEYVSLAEAVAAAPRKCRSCAAPYFVFAAPTPQRRRCGRCKVWNIVRPDPKAAAASPPPAPPVRASDRAPAARPERGSTGARERERERKPAPPSPEPARRRSDATPALGDPLSGALPSQLGPYKIEGLIARGGMGAVYRAFDPQARRAVALKVLRGDADGDLAKRFRLEAEAVARLRHPNIVRVHDVGIDRGTRYFIMDLIEGEDLEAHIQKKSLPRRELVRLVAEVAEALHHAHEQGIIHRDVKPQNVLVEKAAVAARLTDFGLARDLARETLTHDGDLVGTPLFMAPEQIRGEGERVDRRTDVYALGVLLFRALTGKLPFDGRSLLELQEKVLHSPAAPPSTLDPEIPAGLDLVCLRALEKHPDDRYQTSAELARDLRAWLAGKGVATQTVGPAERAMKQVSRNPRKAFFAALALALLVLGLGVQSWLDSRRKADAAREAERTRRAQALARATGAVSTARLAIDKARAAIAGGEPAGAGPRLDEAQATLAEARAALPDVGAEARPELEAKIAAAARAAGRVKVEARALRGASERRAARDEAEALLAEDPKDAELLLVLGRIELDSGRFAAAVKALTRATEADPLRLDAFYFRGEVHRRSGRAAFGKIDFDHALGEGAPAGASLRAVSREVVLAARARAELETGEREGAARDIDEATRTAPGEPAVHIAHAELYESLHDLDSAAQELELACSTDKGAGGASRELGILRVALGDRERALGDLTAALEREPDDRTAAAARARLRALALEDDGARADLAIALDKGSELDPLSPVLRFPWLVRARLARGTGDLGLALATLDRACPATAAEVVPATASIRLERCEVLLARATPADLAAARREAELVAQALPASGRALRVAGEAALAQSDLAPARKWLEAATALDARDPLALASLARVLEKLGDERARAVLASAGRAQRELVATGARPTLDVGPPEEEALELTELGRRLLAGGRHDSRSLDAALRAFKRAAALAPSLAPVRLAVVEALEAKGSTDDALRELEKALLEAPPLVEEKVRRGTLLLSRGERETAIAAFGDAANDLGDAPIALKVAVFLGRGRAILESGDARRALPDLDRACTLDPLLKDSFVARGRARDGTGDSAGAAADRERVTLLEGGYQKVMLELDEKAWALRSQNGEHAVAAKIIEPAFSIVPREAPVDRARIFYTRGFMRLHCLELSDGLMDIAAMAEILPRSLQKVWEELTMPPEAVDYEAVLRGVQERSRDREPDPDFLAGFTALCRVEFGTSKQRTPQARGKAAREGVLALGRYLGRGALHPSALVLRSLLRAHAGDQPGALRDARAALELEPGLGAAEFALFRIYLARRDREAALAHLRAALAAKFKLFDVFARDVENESDLRFSRELALARGRDQLGTIDFLEKRAASERDESERRLDHQHAVAAGNAGVAALANLVRQDDAEARHVSFQLRLARGQSAALAGELRGQGRDLAGALEVSAEALALEWGRVLATARSLEGGSDWEKDLAPWASEAEPSLPFQRAIRVVVSGIALDGKKPRTRPTALDPTISNGTGSAVASALAARSLARLATGDGKGALEDATDARLRAAAPATADLLAARTLVVAGRNQEAFPLLERALAGGLKRGDLAQDPAFDSVRHDPTFLKVIAGSDAGR